MTSARWWRSAVVAGGLVVAAPLSLAGPASADPITDALATTPCSYAQVSAALKAQAPALSLQLAYRPDMQANLQQFLALPVDQRQAQIAQQQSAMDPQTEAMLAAAVGPAVTKVANTCMNY
ncbi:hemophore-related protein [Mycobacterium sp. M26]|uniref:hemophore-related protein n=1 Tax=Mycobacterium sp. M26 TaxID=1762962 RepID=UPI0009EC3D04|nr:hemophore-related protein [Mycobacterium sp. M26]